MINLGKRREGGKKNLTREGARNLMPVSDFFLYNWCFLLAAAVWKTSTKKLICDVFLDYHLLV